MSDAPKVGDYVRVVQDWKDGTKSVHEGKVYSYDPEEENLRFGKAAGIVLPLKDSIWASVTWEKITPPMPTTFGSVVKGWTEDDRETRVFSRDVEGSWEDADATPYENNDIHDVEVLFVAPERGFDE